MKEQIRLSEIINFFESLAPLSLQENWDNSGLQVGIPLQSIHAVLLTLDVTEEVVDEAVEKNCNLIISHHPVIFGGIKRITGNTSVERVLRKAIRNDIALLSLHTNLDNISAGVNAVIAGKLGLINSRILQPARGRLRKLVTFVPAGYLSQVQQAIFEAGAGHIGNYDQCSFYGDGKGTFRGNPDTHPFVGEPEKLHTEREFRFETIYPVWLETRILEALLKSHPYEEVAYDIYPVENAFPMTGSGIIGELTSPVEESLFLQILKETFGIPVIRHSALTGRPVGKVAACGGAGAFLIKEAINAGAGFFVTGDIRYHQFFEAENRIVLTDIGHFESEQFTTNLLHELLVKKFPTFAVRLSEIKTNPVNYYL